MGLRSGDGSNRKMKQMNYCKGTKKKSPPAWKKSDSRLEDENHPPLKQEFITLSVPQALLYFEPTCNI